MKKIENLGKNIIVFFFVCMMLYLAINSLFISADIPLDGMEKTIFHYKIWPITIAIFCMLVFAVYKFHDKIVHVDSHKLIKVLLTYDFILCMFWIVVANTKEGADQAQVLYAAKQFAAGNFAKLAPDQYMGMFPYQLPLALLYEPFYKIFGDVTPFLWQLINAFIICLCQYLIYGIMKELCSKTEIVNMMLFLQFLNFPLVLYVSFVYGTVIGLVLALAAVYFLICYIKREDHCRKYLLLSAVFIGCACWLRTNYLIWMIALCILVCLFAISKKKLFVLLYIPLVIGLFLGGRQLIYKGYEIRSGMEVCEGIPNSLYIAMGLSENDERANGWYNGYTWDLYFDMGCDWEAAEEIGQDVIKTQLDAFLKKPGYMLRFFCEKINSTWLNPDFQALWNNHHHGQAIAYAPVIYNLYTGELHSVTQCLLGNIQFIIYMGALICFLGYRKRLNIQQCIFALIFVGGFLFHLFWETKAQYVIVYYVLLFPYAAAGLSYLSEKTASFLEARKASKQSKNT